MASQPSQTPLQACEEILRDEIRYNVEHNILPSEIAVANRLLARGTELRDAYDELYAKLNPRPPALKAFLGLVLRTAAHWSLEKIAEARAERDLHIELNNRIAACADELASLLDQRSAASRSFTTDTHSSVYEVIVVASEHNHLFNSFVRPDFERLQRFDSRYWPSLAEFIRLLGLNAAQAEPLAVDPLTAAATCSSRPSTADFVEALCEAIKENGAREFGHLPSGFKASDGSLASIINCALDLAPEDVKDGPYIKNIRHRKGPR